MQNSASTPLYKELNQLKEDGKHQEISEKIEQMFLGQSMVFNSAQKIVLSWLKEQYISDTINTRYGFFYSDLFFNLLSQAPNQNTNEYEIILSFALTAFYTNALVTEGDLARCADETAGKNIKAWLEEQYEKHQNDHKKLSVDLQKAVLMGVQTSRTYEKARPVNKNICKDGIGYQDKFSKAKIYEEVRPDIVSDIEWTGKLNRLYEKRLEGLSQFVSEKKTPSLKKNSNGFVLTIPAPEGFMEVFHYMPILKKLTVSPKIDGKSNMYLYASHESLGRALFNFNLVEELFVKGESLYFYINNRRVSLGKFHEIREKIKKDYPKKLVSVAKNLQLQAENFTRALGDEGVDIRNTITAPPIQKNLEERRNYLQMGYMVKMQADLDMGGMPFQEQYAIAMESAVFTVQGRVVMLQAVREYKGEEDTIWLKNKISDWADAIIARNKERQTASKEEDSNKKTVFKIVVLLLIFYALMRSIPKKPVAGQDVFVRQDQAVEDDHVVAEVEPNIKENLERKGNILKKYAEYRGGIGNKIAMIIFICQNAGYMLLGGLAIGGEGSVINVFVWWWTAGLNIFVLNKGESLRYKTKGYLNIATMALNLISLLLIAETHAAGFNLGIWVAVWIGLIGLFVFYAPYRVEKDRTAFFFNLLQLGADTDTSFWRDIPNNMGNRKRMSQFKEDLFLYKKNHPKRLRSYQGQIEQVFMNEYGQDGVWITRYISKNRNTLTLFQWCGIDASTAVRLIMTDRVNRHGEV